MFSFWIVFIWPLFVFELGSIGPFFYFGMVQTLQNSRNPIISRIFLTFLTASQVGELQERVLGSVGDEGEEGEGGEDFTSFGNFAFSSQFTGCFYFFKDLISRTEVDVAILEYYVVLFSLFCQCWTNHVNQTSDELNIIGTP